MPSAMLARRWFYKNYNWTPEVVDRMPLEELFWLPVIESAEAEALDYKYKQMEKSEKPKIQNKPIRGY